MKKRKMFTLVIAILLGIAVIPISSVSALEVQIPIVQEDTDSGSAIVPQSVNSCRINFTKTSSSRAKVTVSAKSSGPSAYITSKVSLQQYSSASGGYVNSSASPQTKTVKASAITHTCYFTVSSSKKYRVKVQLTDKVGTSPVTKTYYKVLDTNGF